MKYKWYESRQMKGVVGILRKLSIRGGGGIETPNYFLFPYFAPSLAPLLRTCGGTILVTDLKSVERFNENLL